MDTNNVSVIQKQESEEPLAKVLEGSIQSQSTADNNILNNFLSMSVKSGELLPSYWSPSRDHALDLMALQNDQFLGVTNKVENRITAATWLIVPRNPTIKSHRHLADIYNSIMFDSLEMGQGLQVWLAKWMWALFTQDNGVFAEIITDDGLAWDKPRQGRVIGSNILDSSRCNRTSNPIFPVVYRDAEVKTAIHYTRVMFTSQQPSSKKGMNGVGKCWLTRAVNSVQKLIDQSIYLQEKLGSRPNSQIIIASGGLDTFDVAKALVLANQSNDNQGLTRFAKKAVVGSRDHPEGRVDIVDLVANDIFNEKESLELGMASLALSGGFPFRDFWPSQGAIAKADAEFSHITGSSGYQQIINTIIFNFSGNPNSPTNIIPKMLPKELELTVTLIDDDQQQRQADVKKKRAETWSIQLDKGMFDVRTVREQAFKTGDVTKEQFEREELESDRLPNGESTLLLFLSDKAVFNNLLALPFANPLNIEENKEQAEEIIKAIDEQLTIVNTIIINGNSPTILLASRQSRSALNLLKKEYEAVLIIETAQDGEAITEELIDETNPEQVNSEETLEQKQTTGANLPDEVLEYEQAIEDLINQANAGDITQEEFENELETLVIDFTTLVFLLGIDEEGEDLEEEEREFLSNQIDNSLGSVSGLSDDVFSNKFIPVAAGGLGHNVKERVALWGGVLGSVFYGGMMQSRDVTLKIQWVWTPGKKHCADCKSRNGTVRTIAGWQEDFNNGIYPKSTKLACKGFRCGCGLFVVN